MKFFTKEVKIALVAILGVVVFFYGVNFLKGLTIFSTATTYYMTSTTWKAWGHLPRCMPTVIRWAW